MNKAFAALPNPSGEQLASIAIVWRKVFLNLIHHQQSSLTRTPRGLIGEAMEAWDMLRPPTVKRPPDLFECMNPRCAIRVTYMGPLEACIVCEECERATVVRGVSKCAISSFDIRRILANAHERHWSLHTSDAHRLECF